MALVPVEKVSLSIDAEVLEAARAGAGEKGLSAYVSDILKREQQRARLRALLDEQDRKYGPISAEEIEEARKLWRDPPKPKRRRKTA